MKSILLAVFPPSGPSQTFNIVSFSMVEPSTMQCRFETIDGRQLEVKGCPIMFVGDENQLPPFTFKPQALPATRQWIQLQRN